jgi:hypothetical protein
MEKFHHYQDTFKSLKNDDESHCSVRMMRGFIAAIKSFLAET